MSKEMPEPTDDRLKECVVSMVVEGWRMGRVAGQLLAKLSPPEQSRHAGQLRWYQRSVEEALSSVGMRIVNTEGQRFDAGMAATPLNVDEFDGDDELVVEQMLEPIIMGPHGIVKMGTVVLRKATS